MRVKLARAASVGVSLLTSVYFASPVFADAASGSANVGGGEGTSSSLANAGSSEITYLIFAAGAMLFVFGMLRLVLSFREVK